VVGGVHLIDSQQRIGELALPRARPGLGETWWDQIKRVMRH
jgi:hypothetical protein